MWSRLRGYWQRVKLLLSVDWDSFAKLHRTEIESSLHEAEGRIHARLNDLLEEQKKSQEAALQSLLVQIEKGESQVRQEVAQVIATSLTDVFASVKSTEDRLSARFEEMQAQTDKLRQETQKQVSAEVAALKEQTGKMLDARVKDLYSQVQSLLSDQTKHIREQLTRFFNGQVEMFKKAVVKGVSELSTEQTEDPDRMVQPMSNWNPSMPAGGLFSSTSLVNMAERPYA